MLDPQSPDTLSVRPSPLPVTLILWAALNAGGHLAMTVVVAALGVRLWSAPPTFDVPPDSEWTGTTAPPRRAPPDP